MLPTLSRAAAAEAAADEASDSPDADDADERSWCEQLAQSQADARNQELERSVMELQHQLHPHTS